jgi:hypothetical protein
MTDLLDNFFNSNGIQKKIPELNYEHEMEIQSVIDEIIKPAFQELSYKISSYSNFKGVILTSKKESNSYKEYIELKVNRVMQLKFVYSPKFSLEDKSIIVTGQFCIPNLHGEAIEFKNTALRKVLSELSESDILYDFSEAFTKNVNIR